MTLARAFVLIDSRHGLKQVDHDYLALLDRAAVVFQVVLTKTDKPKAGALQKTIAQVTEGLQKHPAAFPEILTTSSEKGAGIPELRAAIAGLF